MSTQKLKNDQGTLLDSLFDGRFELEEELLTASDQNRIDALDAEIDRITKQIRRIRGKRIKDLTDSMLNDPQVKADFETIRKGTVDVRKEADRIQQAADRLKSVKKMVDKAIKPIDKIIGFLT
ncbi:MAG: hypothetical protein AAGD13_17945 [Pseudomonadota bacterium]